MMVRALVSFSGPLGTHQAGDVFELPVGADWVQAGLVAPVAPAVERAVDPAPGRAERRGGSTTKTPGHQE